VVSRSLGFDMQSRRAGGSADGYKGQSTNVSGMANSMLSLINTALCIYGLIFLSAVIHEQFLVSLAHL